MTALVPTLAEFICARLEEDVQAALSVSDGPRQPEEWIAKRSQYGRFPRDWVADCPFGSVVVDGAYEGCAVHIARHDPARILRGVAVKRATLELHGFTDDGWLPGENRRCTECGHVELVAGLGQRGAQQSWPCRTVRLLVSEWSTHPDYQQEWRP